MNSMDSILKKQTSKKDWVRESRFGRWFLSTNIWFQYVLSEAFFDLKQLLKNRLSGTHRILDAGCGQGLAFVLLEQHFQPKTIIGVDIDKEEISLASEAAKRCKCEVEFENSTVCNLNIPGSSIDMIFCHQLIHHISDQSTALEEFYRILVPGGLILIGESCRSFINSFYVRLLFRHPLQVQKTADEYVELIKSIGFKINDNDIKTSRPWWSRKDFGLTEKIGLPQNRQEPTEILIIASKPY
jgi:ubiquinone/menaquinone biosynthesis C-methylase UbiE